MSTATAEAAIIPGEAEVKSYTTDLAAAVERGVQSSGRREARYLKRRGFRGVGGNRSVMHQEKRVRGYTTALAAAVEERPAVMVNVYSGRSTP